MKIFYRAGTILLISALVAGYCPVPDSIVPCTCDTIKEGISVQCSGQENAGKIPSVIENLEISQNLELVLESLTLPASDSFFSEVSSLYLYNAVLEAKKPNSSFAWPKLSEVKIKSSYIADTPFPYFKEALSLKHLEISNIVIPTIGSEFRKSIPDALVYLDVRKTKTVTLESQSMRHLRNLQYLILVDLPLQKFPRDALPPLLPDLFTFILGNTKIENLEANFFDGMPKLEVLMLNGNKLTTLDFNLFAPIENHLTHLLAERNPLICDCNLLWLSNSIKKKGSMNVLATCKDDATYTRKEVALLDVNEYCF